MKHENENEKLTDFCMTQTVYSLQKSSVFQYHYSL